MLSGMHIIYTNEVAVSKNRVGNNIIVIVTQSIGIYLIYVHMMA